MSSEVLLAFVATCVLLALTPGPNMALIVANTLSRGRRAGLTTLAGTTTGLALLVAAAAAGMTSIMVLMATWFDAVRWAGAVYLVYLGARQLWRLRRPGASIAMGVDAGPHGGCYVQGLMVSLSNPKVILFLGAFLPQFVDTRADPVGQLTVLAVLFVAGAGGGGHRHHLCRRQGTYNSRASASAPARRRRRRAAAARRPGAGDGATAVIVGQWALGSRHLAVAITQCPNIDRRSSRTETLSSGRRR